MFKNLFVFRFGAAWPLSLSQMEQALQQHRFVECAATQEKAVGWVEPRGEAHSPLVESVGGQWILKLMIERKSLPSSVVRRRLKERVDLIAAREGRKPGKREQREIKDELRLQLLPLAFTKQVSVWVWLDIKSQRLIVDASGQAQAEEVIASLIQCVEGLFLLPLATQLSPVTAMADWLTTQEVPAGFVVDQECELKAADESRAVVRYTRHPLDNQEVRDHIQGGKQPTRLALTWGARVSMVLTDTLQIKKLVFLDVVFENGGTKQDEGFDTDVAIATGELQGLLADLLTALGGEAPIPTQVGN